MAVESDGLKLDKWADVAVHAQFHMESFSQTVEDKQITSNFLRLAQEWGGYNPRAEPLDPPKPHSAGPAEEPASK